MLLLKISITLLSLFPFCNWFSLVLFINLETTWIIPCFSPGRPGWTLKTSSTYNTPVFYIHNLSRFILVILKKRYLKTLLGFLLLSSLYFCSSELQNSAKEAHPLPSSGGWVQLPALPLSRQWAVLCAGDSYRRSFPSSIEQYCKERPSPCRDQHIPFFPGGPEQLHTSVCCALLSSTQNPLRGRALCHLRAQALISVQTSNAVNLNSCFKNHSKTLWFRSSLSDCLWCWAAVLISSPSLTGSY